MIKISNEQPYKVGTAFLGATIEGDFFRAVVKYELNIAEELMEQGVGPNIIADTLSKPLLFLAIEHNAPRVADFLLSHGVDPNMEYNTMTALDHSSEHNNNLSELLREYDAHHSESYVNLHPELFQDSSVHSDM